MVFIYFVPSSYHYHLHHFDLLKSVNRLGVGNCVLNTNTRYIIEESVEYTTDKMKSNP